jgi:epoxide hydrolase 4
MMRLQDLTVRHGEAAVNGTRLHYVEKGSGPLVVMLHGFPDTWWSWRYQLDALANAGFRALAVDLRGFGDSAREGPFDFETVAQDVRGLIAHAGAKRASIIGHDWGGIMAWHFANRMPELCESLTVINGPHPERYRNALVSLRFGTVMRSWYMLFALIPRLPEYLLNAGGPASMRKIYRVSPIDRAHFGDEEIAPFLDAIQKPGTAAAMIGYFRAALRSRALRDGSLFEGYRPLLAPAQILWASLDRALVFKEVVPGTERWAPSVKVHAVEPSGRMAHAERPDLVNPMLIDFLRSSQTAAPAISA